VNSAETQSLIQAALKRGLQTREAEMGLGAMLGAPGAEDDPQSTRLTGETA
jgi:hypothetical protein